LRNQLTKFKIPLRVALWQTYHQSLRAVERTTSIFEQLLKQPIILANVIISQIAIAQVTFSAAKSLKLILTDHAFFNFLKPSGNFKYEQV
jgi:hypothetical protein